MSEGASSIGIVLNDLGDYSDLEGSYSFTTDNFIGQYSLAIPNATKDIALVGEAGVFLSAEISVNHTFDVNGPGSFDTYDYLLLYNTESYPFSFNIDSSAATDAIITVETTYCLVIFDLSINVKVGPLSVFDIGTGPIDQTWCSSDHLGMDISLGSTSTPGFEIVGILLVISVISIRTSIKRHPK
ncbi:MAG: hypothetical protein ACW981_15405 [Candidatus Hodarchaeales archaeon]|jgi:hypothetical protein